MAFEDLLEEVGSFGRYQKVLCFGLVTLGTALCALTFYSQIFILQTPKYACRDRDVYYDKELKEFTWQELKNNTSGEYFTCSPTCSQLDGSTKTPKCTRCTKGWIYATDEFYETIVSQNNWICEDDWRPTAIVSAFWASNAFGAWTFGILSDRFGRRLAIRCAFLLYGLGSLTSAFFEDFWVFLILRSIVGFCHHSVSHLSLIFVIEHCGLKSRVIPLLTYLISYTLASMITPLLAMQIWNWKMLTLVTSFPTILMVIISKWLPESPSWLLVNGRREEGFKQLEFISKVNGNQKTVKELEEVYDKSPHKSHSAEVSILQVWHFPRLRRNMLLGFLTWTCCCFCYYGHCFYTSSIGSNIFMSYFLGNCMEIFSWIIPYGIDKFGRKKPLTACLFLAGGLGFLYIIIVDWSPNFALVMALLARLAICCAYDVTLQFCSEIFPTVVRGQGIAVTETLGSAGTFIAPLVLFAGRFSTMLPMVIFSAVAILVSFTTVLLPETNNVELPQTLEDGESFATGNANRK